MSTGRAADIVRLGLGMAIVTRPTLPLKLMDGRPHPHERAAVRILGVRYLAQSVIGLAVIRSRQGPATRNRRRQRMRDVDAAIEMIHAATMLGLAATSPQHRRLALLSAGTALCFSAADLQGNTRREHSGCVPPRGRGHQTRSICIGGRRDDR